MTTAHAPSCPHADPPGDGSLCAPCRVDAPLALSFKRIPYDDPGPCGEGVVVRLGCESVQLTRAEAKKALADFTEALRPLLTTNA